MEPQQGGTGGPVNFTMISDKTVDLARLFWVKRSNGMPRVVGRSVDDVLRTVQAIKEVDKRTSEEEIGVCIPAGWKEGEEVIINTSDGKKEFYRKRVTDKPPAGTMKDDEIKTEASVRSATILTAGPEVSCPVNNWFYKIPNL